MRRRNIYHLLLTTHLLLLCASSARAGQVILTLPDEQLKGTIEEVCLWNACESERKGGYKSDEEKARWVADKLVNIVSMGHYAGLADVQGTLDVHYDTPPPEEMP